MKYKDLILAVETTSETCGVVLSSEGKLLAEFSFFINQMHDEYLAVLVKRICEDLAIDFNEISAVALSSGPGSFTGLRIGTAFVMGFLFNNNIKFIDVPTLEGLAEAAKEFAISKNSQRIYTYLKSHKDLFYVQEFNTNIEAVSEIDMINFDALQEKLKTDIVFAGNYFIESEYTLSGLQRLTPRFTALRAWKKYQKNEFADINKFAPLYHLDFKPKQEKES